MNNEYDIAERIIKIALSGSFLLFIVLFIAAFLFRYSTTRQGEHSGYVTALEQSGYFFHNYRVYFKTDNSSSQEDIYCVQEGDTNLIAKLREVNKSRKQVTIQYDGVRGIGFGLCSGEKIIEVD